MPLATRSAVPAGVVCRAAPKSPPPTSKTTNARAARQTQVSRPRPAEGTGVSFSPKLEEAYPVLDTYRVWPTQIRIPNFLFYAGEVAVVLLMLMFWDAGYSGDWSRIGVITKAQEVWLQDAFEIMVAAHVFLAFMAMKIAKDYNFNVAEAGIKSLLSGTLGLFEVHQRCTEQDLGRSKA